MVQLWLHYKSSIINQSFMWWLRYTTDSYTVTALPLSQHGTAALRLHGCGCITGAAS